MHILGIETSCDDTGVTLIETNGAFGADFNFKILGNALSSQTALHAQYGGVFPAMAKREHAKNLVPTLSTVLQRAGMGTSGTSIYGSTLNELLQREPELLAELVPFLEQHEKPDIDAIAVTVGPGLEPCLWVGINFARVLGVAWNIPIVGVNHMEGHIIMSMIDFVNQSSGQLSPFEFPALALLISGGHTELVLMRKFGKYEIIGHTRDDAVGEAFDKVARMLGLPYPGGPHISRLAEEARSSITTHDVVNVSLPRPMINDDNFDFSFSGLKTAVLRLVENKTVSDDTKKQIAREFEDAVTDVLTSKTLRAVEEYGANAVILGGGVSANRHIRNELASKLEAVSSKLLVCPPEFSTDNAVMIALAGYFHALKKEFSDPETLAANGSLKLG
jgi:N6-L-threonylcarbamoyladenine synthase